jgi:hypothetical protein
MNFVFSRMPVVAFACALFSAHDAFAAPTSAFATAELGQLVTVDALPMPNGELIALSVQRRELYAPGAKIIWMDSGVARELTHSTRHFFSGVSADGAARVAFSTASDGSDATGVVFYRSASADVRQLSTGAWELVAKPAADAAETPTFQCGNTPERSAVNVPASNANPLALDAATPGENALFGALYATPEQRARNQNPSAVFATRSAVLAFDVDIEAIANKFGGSTATANNYLPTLVNAININYDAPLNVQLLVGTSFLRTGSDPYGSTTNTNTQLDLLAVQWRDNHAAVARAFVMLISGVQSNGCSASGLAWVDAYCRNGTAGSTNVYGSYSVNQLFHTGCSGLLNSDVRIAGHELGHNFGASHTHCTSNGAGGTIDQCFSGEGGSCFSGAQSCPAAGGTLMSYCHLLGGCTTSLDFHPLHINLITPKISAAVAASCFQTASTLDPIFRNGFE